MKHTTIIFIFVMLIIGQVSYAQDCYESSILSPSPFLGNNGEIAKLADGSLWEVKYEYQYLYEYYPNVIICPSKGKLVVKGKSLNVVHVGRSGGARQIQNSVSSYNNDNNQANCISLINQRTGALTSKDWQQLVTISSQYINECVNTHDKESISSAYLNIAIAYMNTGNYVEAYNASNKCIDVFYNNVMCHVNKAESLINLNRYEEATIAYNKSVKLIDLVVDINNRDIINSTDDSLRKLYESKRNGLEACRQRQADIYNFLVNTSSENTQDTSKSSNKSKRKRNK